MTAPMALVPLTEAQLRRRRSLKWSRAFPGSIPADVAEADFAVAEPIRDVLSAAAADSDLGYPDFDSIHGGPRRLAEIYAHRMRTKFGFCATPARVEVCAQVMQALCGVILTFSEPGDGVLVHTPTYPPIERTIVQLGRRPMLVPVGDDCQPPDRVAVIVVCNPHNPTGAILSHGHLAALAELAARHGAVIFADEVYQDLTYDEPHCAIAAHDAAAERTISFTSAAKSFNIPGLRCAVGHFGSPALHRKFTALPWHLRNGAGMLGIEATIVAWTACDPWLDAFRAQLHRNRERVARSVLATSCQYTPPEATYFAWLDLRDSSRHPGAVESLRKDQRLLMQDGSVYGQRYKGFARLNFAVPDERLIEILSRFAQIFPSRDLARPVTGQGAY